MKRSILFCGLFISALVMVASCNKASKNDFTYDYFPFKLDANENWGLMDKNLKPLFSDEFEGTLSACYNGVFSVKKNGKYSLYTASEKPQLINGCEDLLYAGYMSEGVIPVVRKGGRITYVDKSGETQFTLMPYEEKEIILVQPCFLEGRAIIMTENGKWGFIDNKGKIVVEPKYDGVTGYSEGYAIAWKDIDKENEKKDYFIVDKNGKEIKKLPSGSGPNMFKDGKIVCYGESGRVLLVNTKGEIVKKFPTKVTEVREYNKDYYIYRDKDAKCGLNNMKDESLIRAKYTDLSFVGDDRFLANRNNKYTLIDKGDNVITTFDFEDNLHWAYFDEDLSMIVARYLDSRQEFFDIEGKRLANESYYVEENDCSIHSDYFNAESIANKIAKIITEKGIDNIELRQPAMKYIKSIGNVNSSQNYAWIKSFDDIYEVNYSLTIHSEAYIAEDEYETIYNGWHFEQRYKGKKLNPNAKVDKIYLGIEFLSSRESVVDNTKNLVNSLEKTLNAKGLKTKERNDYSLAFENGIIIEVRGIATNIEHDESNDAEEPMPVVEAPAEEWTDHY